MDMVRSAEIIELVYADRIEDSGRTCELPSENESHIHSVDSTSTQGIDSVSEIASAREAKSISRKQQRRTDA